MPCCVPDDGGQKKGWKNAFKISFTWYLFTPPSVHTSVRSEVPPHCWTVALSALWCSPSSASHRDNVRTQQERSAPAALKNPHAHLYHSNIWTGFVVILSLFGSIWHKCGSSVSPCGHLVPRHWLRELVVATIFIDDLFSHKILH